MDHPTTYELFEGMTSISALLNTSSDVNDRRILTVYVDQTKQKSKARELSFLRVKAAEHGFAIEFLLPDEIEQLASGKTHGGILARVTARTIPSIKELSLPEKGFFVYLEGMEDPYNFGYTLRSLYAAGVDGVLLPERNWMSASGIVARASAGTSERMPLYTAASEEIAPLFHKHGYRMLCAGIRDSVSIFEEHFAFPLLLVIGGEKRGISHALLESADAVVRIDYGRPFMGSLSAASAASVIAFELFRQNIKK